MTTSASDNPQTPQTPFELIRRVDSDGVEFWSARDLMLSLEYTEWRNFKTALLKAQFACENSGFDPADHFVGATKMVPIGSNAQKRSA